MPNEQWKVSTHSNDLDAFSIERVITMNEAAYHRHDFIQCYADSATLNISAVGVHAFAVYPAEVMDAICEEWQRFRRELAAHEAQKPQEVKSKEVLCNNSRSHSHRNRAVSRCVRSFTA